MIRISKEETVKYVVTAVDDMLAEDPQRTRLFFEFAKKTRTSPWNGFINLLNRQNTFIVHQVRIFCVICWRSPTNVCPVSILILLENLTPRVHSVQN